MLRSIAMERPRRWDSPSDPDMTDEVVDRILAVEPFCNMDTENFPPSVSLRDIIRFMEEHFSGTGAD